MSESFLTEIKTKNYFIKPSGIKIGKEIGSGSFGFVYRGTYKKKKVAIKEMRGVIDEWSIADFDKEVEMLSKSESKFVIEFFGISLLSKRLSMVTEFAKHGSLQDLMGNEKDKPISIKLRIKMMVDSAKGIKFLHTNGILHRDIKPASILVVSLDDNEQVNAKLTDFGILNDENLESSAKRTINIGSPVYMAPEFLNQYKYEMPSDIYSFAITMYECFGWCDCYPKDEFKDRWDVKDFVKEGKRRPKPDNMTNDQYQLIQQCWEQEPKERIGIKRLVENLEGMNNGMNKNNIERVANAEYEIPYDSISIGERKLGEGSFGIVYLGTFRGNKVAIKKMKGGFDQDTMNEFKKEVSMLDKFRSEYIVHFYGAVFIPNCVCMVTEFAQFGSLQDLINRRKNEPLTMKLRIKMMIDSAKGIQYLHSNGILHRDIKPDNILVVSLDGNENVNAKITDFGSSKSIDFFKTNKNTINVGTPAFMAPEVMVSGKYNEKADIYSFAITMYECFGWCECYPKTEFKFSWNIGQFISEGKRRPRPDNMTYEQYHLIQQCWKKDPEERIRIEEVVKQLEDQIIEKEQLLEKKKQEDFVLVDIKKGSIMPRVLLSGPTAKEAIKNKIEGKKKSSNPLRKLKEKLKNFEFTKVKVNSVDVVDIKQPSQETIWDEIKEKEMKDGSSFDSEDLEKFFEYITEFDDADIMDLSNQIRYEDLGITDDDIFACVELEKDEAIKQETTLEMQIEKEMKEEMKQIEEWSGMKIGNIIFDSDVDDWDKGTSVFDQKIINKSNLIFLIEDDDNNKFGGYVNAKIDESLIKDSKSFVFSLKSNGRLNGMLKFDIKQSQNAFWLNNQSHDWLFSIGNGDIIIRKEKYKNLSFCDQDYYNYNGIKNALCGKTFFTPKKITVIQLI